MLRRRPHKRFRNACDGTGRMPAGLLEACGTPEHGYYERAACPVCEHYFPIRKHANRAKGWLKGSLRMHRGQRRSWWRRLPGWVFR